MRFPSSITWHPIVLSFSFTSKELRNDPWAKPRDDLEQLDIKYSADYDYALTSHVVTKKRNTSKGLQALINGRYIVTDSFVNAVIDAATPADTDDPGLASVLEQDYDANWPDALSHLPPRGEEPSDRPAEAYAPDERRQDVFEGYTFVFYEKKQYDNLFSAITNGKGKALFQEVLPHQTKIDDFIRYVKGVAGERGLGSFEDGSEGRGVVVVRYLPAKGADFDWFAEFLTSVALRLDHRPIDQREFLDAILSCDASMLRRPLEEESQPEPAATGPRRLTSEDSRSAEASQSASATSAPKPTAQDAPAPQPRRGRTRRAAASRFKGFDLGSDPVDVAMPDSSSATAAATDPPSSIHPETQLQESSGRARRSQRKRTHSPMPVEDDIDMMDGIAPTATAAKRRRIEAGEPLPGSTPAPGAADDQDVAPESPVAKSNTSQPNKTRGKAKTNQDILELARQHREEAEAKATAERDALNKLPDDGIDYAAIRALHIVEECTVHLPDASRPVGAGRSREQDLQDGRWDPRWNGRQNFKKFRRQGEPAGRPAPRVIIGLEEAKTKEYGIGDDYWLEDEATIRKKKDSQRESQTQAPATGTPSQNQPGLRRKSKEKEKGTAIAIDSSDEEQAGEGPSTRLSSLAPDPIPTPTLEPEPESEPEPEPSRTRAGKAATRANTRRGKTRSQAAFETQPQSQSQPRQQLQPRTHTTRSSKRIATTPPAAAKEKVAKKPRKAIEIRDSDDSDDEPRFRFGRR